MAQAVNVILEIKDSQGRPKTFDINEMGLVSMTFDRYLGTPTDATSSVLANLDITMFDKSGYQLLSIIQNNRQGIRLRYGLDKETNMSKIYNMSITKFKSTFNNLGCMVAMGAVASQSNATFKAEIYKAGTPVEDIIISMAKRNGWDIGSLSNGRYSNVDGNNVKLYKDLLKASDETDIDFIKNKLVNVCNASAYTLIGTTKYSTFWESRLYFNGQSATLIFLPISKRVKITRVWDYDYGASNNSAVISITNTIDYSFLLNGLTIQIPAAASEFLLENDADLQQRYSSMVYGDMWADIKPMFEKYNLPVPSTDEYKLKIKFIEAENASDISIKARIFEAIKNTIYSLNTIELEVLGNPAIMPLDLVRLTVKNNYGHDNIASGMWKVIGIQENIGMSGYKTKLSLVREDIDIDYEI